MGKVNARVGGILMLYDEMTGRAFQRDLFQVKSADGRRAIYKENGIYAFVGDKEENMEVSIWGEGYQKKTYVIKKEMLGKVQYLWMMPEKNHPGIGEFSSVLGTTQERKIVSFYIESVEFPCHLLHKAAVGERKISFYHLPYDCLEGRKLHLSDGEWEEDIFLTGVCEQGKEKTVYCLEEPLQYGYLPEKTKIRRIVQAIPDREGNFFAIFRGISKAGSECKIQCKEQTWQITLRQKEFHTIVCAGQE